MTESTKLCTGCSLTKSHDDFYRAGEYLQKLCKPCHNKSRKNYHQKKKYVKKPTGFQKLEKKTRTIIKNSIGKVPLKDIAKENNVSYSTLCYWNRTGKIV